VDPLAGLGELEGEPTGARSDVDERGTRRGNVGDPALELTKCIFREDQSVIPIGLSGIDALEVVGQGSSLSPRMIRSRSGIDGLALG
jgi:hypothetical protein